MLPEIDLTDSASLPEDELRAFPTPHDGPQVLLARHKGQVTAFAAHCPHYGAPLAKGKLVEGRIICPWHHACFQVADGTLCEPPALDDLPTFGVREAEGRIWVQVPASPAASTDDPAATPTAEVGGTPPAPPTAPADARTFVLLGAGPRASLRPKPCARKALRGALCCCRPMSTRPTTAPSSARPTWPAKPSPPRCRCAKKLFMTRSALR